MHQLNHYHVSYWMIEIACNDCAQQVISMMCDGQSSVGAVVRSKRGCVVSRSSSRRRMNHSDLLQKRCPKIGTCFLSHSAKCKGGRSGRPGLLALNLHDTNSRMHHAHHAPGCMCPRYRKGHNISKRAGFHLTAHIFCGFGDRTSCSFLLPSKNTTRELWSHR